MKKVTKKKLTFYGSIEVYIFYFLFLKNKKQEEFLYEIKELLEENLKNNTF